jgi:hypothetical protein
MLNKYLKLISLLFFSLTVNGCGGSGGGDSTESGNNTEEGNNEVNVVEEESVTEPRLTMDSLVAAEDFKFISKNKIQLVLALTNEQQRAYVSVYSKYQLLDSGDYYPDPVSKVVAGALQDGIYKESFTGLNNQQQYLIEVWFYDGSDPLQKELMVNDNRLLW